MQNIYVIPIHQFARLKAGIGTLKLEKRKLNWGTSKVFHCRFCSYFGSSGSDVSTHYLEMHSMEVRANQFDFESYECFKAWMTYTISQSKFTIVRPRIKKGAKSSSCIMTVWCEEGFEGINWDASTRKCPASFRAVLKRDGTIAVDYISTHWGHSHNKSDKNLDNEPKDSGHINVSHSCIQNESKFCLNVSDDVMNYSYVESGPNQEEPLIDYMECGPPVTELDPLPGGMMDDSTSTVNEADTRSATLDIGNVKVEGCCSLELNGTIKGVEASHSDSKQREPSVLEVYRLKSEQVPVTVKVEEGTENELDHQEFIQLIEYGPTKIEEDYCNPEMTAVSKCNVPVSPLPKQHLTPADKLLSPSTESLSPTLSFCNPESSVVDHQLIPTNRRVSERLRKKREHSNLHNVLFTVRKKYCTAKKVLLKRNYSVIDDVVSTTKPLKKKRGRKQSTEIYNHPQQDSPSIKKQSWVPYNCFGISPPTLVQKTIQNTRTSAGSQAEKCIIRENKHCPGKQPFPSKPIQYYHKIHDGTQTPKTICTSYNTPQNMFNADRPRKCYSNKKKSDISIFDETPAGGLPIRYCHKEALEKGIGTATDNAVSFEYLRTPRCSSKNENDYIPHTPFKGECSIDAPVGSVEPASLIHHLDLEAFDLPENKQQPDVSPMNVFDDYSYWNILRGVKQRQRRKHKCRDPVTLASHFVNMIEFKQMYPNGGYNSMYSSVIAREVVQKLPDRLVREESLYRDTLIDYKEPLEKHTLQSADVGFSTDVFPYGLLEEDFAAPSLPGIPNLESSNLEMVLQKFALQSDFLIGRSLKENTNHTSPVKASHYALRRPAFIHTRSEEPNSLISEPSLTGSNTSSFITGTDLL